MGYSGAGATTRRPGLQAAPAWSEAARSALEDVEQRRATILDECESGNRQGDSLVDRRRAAREFAVDPQDRVHHSAFLCRRGIDDAVNVHREFAATGLLERADPVDYTGPRKAAARFREALETGDEVNAASHQRA